MARLAKRLSARGALTKRKPGYHPDGDGLYLQVTEAGTRSWVFRFMLRGRSREMGLGRLADVSLERGRELAAAARGLLKTGVDPIEYRREVERQRAQDAASALTFDQCVALYLPAMSAGWRNPKHKDQWKNTLATYAGPIIGALPVREIGTEDMRRVLDPIWNVKPETASRVRGRVEKILAWATMRGYRSGENPARWRGHLDREYQAKPKLRPVRHHPALPYAKMGDCMKSLRAREGTGARALEFVILTACRVSEAVGSTWSEIDFDTSTWTVPASRMKAHRPQRVALSGAALAALEKMRLEGYKPKGSDHIFPGLRKGKPLTIAAPLKLLRDMGYASLTVHGFRSSFRDWAAERTNYPRQVVEAALAHTLGDSTETSYLRTDLLDRRRPLMQAWAQHCAEPQKAADVLPLQRGERSAKSGRSKKRAA